MEKQPLVSDLRTKRTWDGRANILSHLRGNGFARPTPRREEVDEHDVVLSQLLLEVVGVVDVVNGHFERCRVEVSSC